MHHFGYGYYCFTDGCRVFIGSRRLREWGLPQTTIYHDPIMVRSEVERFDFAFFDAVAACLGKESYEAHDCGSRQLKEKVIQHLKQCMSLLDDAAHRPLHATHS